MCIAPEGLCPGGQPARRGTPFLQGKRRQCHRGIRSFWKDYSCSQCPAPWLQRLLCFRRGVVELRAGPQCELLRVGQ